MPIKLTRCIGKLQAKVAYLKLARALSQIAATVVIQCHWL